MLFNFKIDNLLLLRNSNLYTVKTEIYSFHIIEYDVNLNSINISSTMRL